MVWQILQQVDKQKEWMAMRGSNEMLYYAKAVRKYRLVVEWFWEGKLQLMHMLGGMLAQLWKIMEI